MALPDATALPQIIPGPGLPSLASLNLTSAQLYSMPAPEFHAVLGARKLDKRVRSCFNGNQCTLDAAVGCYSYLNNLGTTMCEEKDPNLSLGDLILCSSGPCVVLGYADRVNAPVFSYCRDVAYGVSVVAFNCPHDGSHAGAGTDVAWGNGDFAVQLSSVV